MIHFEVPGSAAPQGSKRHIGKGVMIESSKAVGPWRDRVAVFAKQAMRLRRPFVGAVAVAIIFDIPRPKSDPRRRFATTRPDLDKLERAILDAITGVVIKDDSLVVSMNSRKTLVAWDAPACARISVVPLEDR